MKQGAAPSPALTCHRASELITVHRPPVFLHTSDTVFKRHQLFTSSTQRVCSVGLTATCTSLSLQPTAEYHLMVFLSRLFEPRFQRGAASKAFVDPEPGSAANDFTHSSSAWVFCFSAARPSSVFRKFSLPAHMREHC